MVLFQTRYWVYTEVNFPSFWKISIESAKWRCVHALCGLPIPLSLCPACPTSPMCPFSVLLMSHESANESKLLHVVETYMADGTEWHKATSK